MPPLLRSVIFLRPPKGPTLVLKDEETLIGRGTFELSQNGQNVCSRRQACLKRTDTAVQLECQGLNPIYFIACHSVNFKATVGTPLSNLYLLRKGEVVDLTDGDKFFLAPKECLLTVGITQIKSGQGDAALQLTPDSGLLNTHDEPCLENQDVLPKATQTDQVCTTFLDGQHRLFPNGEQARSPSNEVQVSPIAACFTSDVCTFVEPGLSCFAGPLHKEFTCNAVGDNLAFPSSQLPAPLSETCPNVQDDSAKNPASVDPGSAELSVCRRGSNQVIGTGVASKSTVPDVPFSAPSLSSELDVPRLAGSSGKSGDYPNYNQQDFLAASNSKEGRGCGPINDTSGSILIGDVHLHPDNCSLGSRSPLNVVEIDHEVANDASTFFKNGNTTLSGLSVSEPNQIREDEPFETICGLESKQDPPKSWQSCQSSRVPSSSCVLPSSGIDSDVDVCGAPLSVEIPDKQGDIEASSTFERVKSSEKRVISAGLQIRRKEDFDIGGGRRMPLRQPDVVDLTISASTLNGQAQPKSPTVNMGQCIHEDGPVQGMETVIATVSGYDNLLRGRLITVINLTGAFYTGSLTNNNTHVVCWKFTGAKYEMAKKLGKCIVSHRWFEDCLKSGTRLSEEQYQRSGEMEEPLCWEEGSMRSPSVAGSVLQQACVSRNRKEHPQERSWPASMIGESSVPVSSSVRITEHGGRRVSSSRNKTGELDKGKGHSVVDLKTISWGACNPGASPHEPRQTRSKARSGDVQEIDISGSHRGQEHESDEFWNEVLRVCEDDRGSQNAENPCEKLPETNLSEVSGEHRTSNSRQIALSVGGSSFRNLDREFDLEITDGQRDQFGSTVRPSGDSQSERLDREVASALPVREQAGNLQDSDDHMAGHPGLLLRKRKHVSGLLSNQGNGKYRRLVRKGVQPRVSDDLSNANGNADGMGICIRSGDQPAVVATHDQLGAAMFDMRDECQPCISLLESVQEPGCTPGGKGRLSVPEDEIVCVICHSETKPITEGMLTCGHKFCYPCIQRWADEAKLKSPTCPLCKVPFEFITFREMSKSGENENCTQVLEERIVEVGLHTHQETSLTSLRSLRIENLCVTCGSRDTPELLLICTNCRERACHTFCLDPPRPPGSSWFCCRCSQRQSRIQTREAYGRLFAGSSPRSTLHRRLDVMEFSMNPLTNTTRVAGFIGSSSSRSPSRRGRQHSLYHFLVRNNV